MDLILWRHAEAEVLREGFDDLARSLTPKGERQAARMATWLDGHLPEGTRILCSPARRAEQTVLALGRRYKLREELAPNAQADEVLRLIRWDPRLGPQGKGPVLLVGHQPWLGQVAAAVLHMPEASCPVRKAAVWWLRTRVRDEQAQTVVMTVACPDLLSRSWDEPA